MMFGQWLLGNRGLRYLMKTLFKKPNEKQRASIYSSLDYDTSSDIQGVNSSANSSISKVQNNEYRDVEKAPEVEDNAKSIESGGMNDSHSRSTSHSSESTSSDVESSLSLCQSCEDALLRDILYKHHATDPTSQKNCRHCQEMSRSGNSRMRYGHGDLSCCHQQRSEESDSFFDVGLRYPSKKGQNPKDKYFTSPESRNNCVISFERIRQSDYCVDHGDNNYVPSVNSLNENQFLQFNSNAVPRATRRGARRPAYGPDRGLIMRRARYGAANDPNAPNVRHVEIPREDKIRMEPFHMKPCANTDKIYFDTVTNEELERFLRHSKRLVKRNMRDLQEVMRSVDKSYVIGLLSQYGPKRYPVVECQGLAHRSCRHGR